MENPKKEAVNKKGVILTSNEETSDKKGAEELVERYNINDQAHHDSSKEDFIETVSNFHHADEENHEDNNKE